MRESPAEKKNNTTCLSVTPEMAKPKPKWRLPSIPTNGHSDVRRSCVSSVALQELLGKRKDKKLCNKAVEVENPGKQTTGGPSQWGKGKNKKTEPRCFMEKTFVPHQGLSSGDATQSSPPHLVKKKGIYTSGRRVEAAPCKCCWLGIPSPVPRRPK